MLDDHLIDQGFVCSSVDYCLYMLNVGDNIVRIAVFVDDLIIACNDDQLLCQVKNMHVKFKMTDLGDLIWFLGIHFERGEDYIALSQTKYLENLLNAHGM